MTTKNISNIVVFLGGIDAEMNEIRKVLETQGISFCDNKLGWGAAASAYTEEIAKAVSQGKTPVLVELNCDIELPEGSIEIDHHGERASEPAAILQILSLIGLEPTRHQQLIAANDCGYIPAMLALSATAEEVAEVRLLDRQAQGITAEQETEAERAIANAEVVNGLTVIRMKHSKCSPVTDRLFNPEEPQHLLILSEDGESNYYGNGLICKKLLGEDTGEKTPEGYVIYSNFGGWTGGSGLGDINGIAYWGGYGDQNAIMAFVSKSKLR